MAERWTKFGNIYGEKNIHAENLKPDALLVGSVRDDKVTFFDLEKWDLIRKWDKPDVVKEREKQAQYDPQRYMWANPNAPIAVECERTRRGGRKFFLKLNSYMVAMAEGRVSQVVFVFDSESLMHEFEEKFKRAEWPRPHVDQKSGKLLRGDLHTVSLDHPIRKRVHFRFTEPLGTQVVRIKKRPRKPLSREKVASSSAS
ncbi:MAG: hypothetical protein EOP10_34280 [Proteobacteria bacterium]|nr:MAG: hypothetical protein EOP10_34280 [Pseudomonadota bacterium]